MAYIYCITNQLNLKKYVGKSTSSLEKRWVEHCKDARKERCEKRPLYDAMNKYGEENFLIELLGEYSELELGSYESYWIEKLNTFKDGYNATLGGDGSILFDYQLIVDTYNDLKSVAKTSEKIGCCVETTRKVLHLYKINFDTKEVIQLKDGIPINSFVSIREAADWIYNAQLSKGTVKSIAAKICNVCKGSKKSAFKYTWRYCD